MLDEIPSGHGYKRPGIRNILFNGNEAQILRHVLHGRVALLASLDTLEELREVLARPKFQLTQSEALALFRMVRSKCEIVLNSEKAEIKCRDSNGQKFLDCAAAGKADYLDGLSALPVRILLLLGRSQFGRLEPLVS